MSQKIDKLKELYDLNKPEDLFTVLPQEMEVIEAKGLAYDLSGADKKKEVVKIITGIAKKQKTNIDDDILSVFIDIIIAASKGKYALNKE